MNVAGKKPRQFKDGFSDRGKDGEFCVCGRAAFNFDFANGEPFSAAGPARQAVQPVDGLGDGAAAADNGNGG